MRLSTQDQHLEKLVSIVEQLIKRAGLGNERSNEFISAVREGITNGAHHGNQDDKNKYLQVEYSVDKQKITFTITDEGLGFDYEAALKKAAGSSEDILSQSAARSLQEGGGLGIVLMKKCVDELAYVPPGNILSLAKYLRVPKKK